MGGESENELARILVQSSVDGLFAIDREVRYTLWNRAMESFAGKTADEVLGRNVFDVFPFLRDLGLDAAVERAFAGESVILECVPNRLPGGEVHYFDRHYLPLRDDGGQVVGMIGLVRDATARHAAEEALRSSEAKLRTAVEAAGVGLWSWDVTRDEVTWDAVLCAMFGLSTDAFPRDETAYMTLVHPEDRERVKGSIAAGVAKGSWEGEHRIVRTDGHIRWLLAKATVVPAEGRPVVHGAVIDVSDRHAREEQARKAQRLEAVGQLTAGIAHNFNNILMALLPNLELAREGASPAVSPLLSSAEHAARRAANLVRQLMTFAGRGQPTARTTEAIGPLVERTVAFCRATFDRRIVVHGAYDRGACARVDPALIEQATANLVINARDALGDPSVESPRLDVEVCVVPAASAELGDRQGDFVRLRVQDNGVGMSPPDVVHVFEPFFTTKGVGKGTGLGLATTHAVVREHGGFVTCESLAGKGTTFSLYLPCEARERAEAERDPHDDDGALGGSESVLVVDDEAPIRRLVLRILSAAGYVVQDAASGDAAVALLADPRTSAEIALVLLDVSMPGLSGDALRRKVRELAPHARIVAFTGYAPESLGIGGGPGDPDAILEKPATAEQLLGTLRDVLDRPR